MKVSLCGLGRAGKELTRALTEHEDIEITSAFCRTNSDKSCQDIGIIAQLPAMGISAADISQIDTVWAFQKPDVVIDFSSPPATRQLLYACAKAGVPAVVCTTGFTLEEIEWMRESVCAEEFGLVYAPNVTVGINVLMSMLKTATRSLPYYDYEIMEKHHNKKIDSPSGTAKKIAAILENELHFEPTEHVPIHAVRAGGYVGVHEVMMVGEYERISIVHESFSRRVFAEGAIEAARYVVKHPGWHEMEDVVSDMKDYIRI